MGQSGIQEVLEIVYGNNAVIHMLNGKAISRTIRGHLLVGAALLALLAARAFGVQLPHVTTTASAEHDNHSMATSISHDPSNSTDQEVIAIDPHDDTEIHVECVEIKDSLMKNPPVAADDVESSNYLAELDNKVHQTKDGLANCPTAKLLLQYLDTLDIVCRFLKAERTGQWLLHLQAVSDMLPYFSASGHNLYTKSVVMYLYAMSQPQATAPNIYTQFRIACYS